MLKVIFWMILPWLKTLKTQKEFLLKSARKWKSPKLLKPRLMKLQNFIAQLLSEVLLFTSCYLTCRKSTLSINILSNPLSTLSTELSTRLQKVFKLRLKCSTLMPKERPLFLKLKSGLVLRKQQRKILNNKKFSNQNNKNLQSKNNLLYKDKRNKGYRRKVKISSLSRKRSNKLLRRRNNLKLRSQKVAINKS